MSVSPGILKEVELTSCVSARSPRASRGMRLYPMLLITVLITEMWSTRCRCVTALHVTHNGQVLGLCFSIQTELKTHRKGLLKSQKNPYAKVICEVLCTSFLIHETRFNAVLYASSSLGTSPKYNALSLAFSQMRILGNISRS